MPRFLGMRKRFRLIKRIGSIQNTYHVCVRAESTRSRFAAWVAGYHEAAVKIQHIKNHKTAVHGEYGGTLSPLIPMAAFPRQEETFIREGYTKFPECPACYNFLPICPMDMDLVFKMLCIKDFTESQPDNTACCVYLYVPVCL